MGAIIKSCLNCEKRILGCHSTCPDYLSEKAEYDRLKEKENRDRAIQNGISAERSRAVRRSMGKNWNRGRKVNQYGRS